MTAYKTKASQGLDFMDRHWLKENIENFNLHMINNEVDATAVISELESLILVSTMMLVALSSKLPIQLIQESIQMNS